jgi:large subunit ribosomal protein L6
MKKEIFQKISIPADVEADLDGDELVLRKGGNEIKKAFDTNKISLEKKGNDIYVGSKKASKNEKTMINTIAAHIRNMVKGLEKEFEYRLKVCSTHFPISTEISGNEVIIKNFLGEKTPRKSRILEGVKVKIEKDLITVSSFDKENAGQTASNLERATWIRLRDRRIFQDGIFMINKAGKQI